MVILCNEIVVQMKRGDSTSENETESNHNNIVLKSSYRKELLEKQLKLVRLVKKILFRNDKMLQLCFVIFSFQLILTCRFPLTLPVPSYLSCKSCKRIDKGRCFKNRSNIIHQCISAEWWTLRTLYVLCTNLAERAVSVISRAHWRLIGETLR